MPNEQSNASTVKLQLQFPDGFAAASYEPRADWRVKVTRAKLATPVQTDDGPITEGVKTITWTGSGSGLGRIAPDQFMEFPLSVQIPENAAGKTLVFKAIQTYSNGDVVRWIGAADSDHPAPHVTVAAASAGSGSAAPGPPAAPASPADGGGERHDRRHRAHRRRHRAGRRGGCPRHHPAPAPRRHRAGRMRRTIAAAALAAAAVLAVCAGTAWGHTGVERYVPGKGATVSTPVKVVGLRFEGPIVTGTLTLTTASGRAIAPREQGVVSRDTYLRMVLRSPLAAGSYRVAWRVRFEDGHRKQDTWTFRVR